MLEIFILARRVQVSADFITGSALARLFPRYFPRR